MSKQPGIFISLIVICLFSSFSLGAVVTQTFTVQAQADDGIATATGLQSISDAHLAIGDNRTYALPYQISAMRFAYIDIPRSATILSANLSIRSLDYNHRGSVKGSLRAETTDNAADYTARNISDAPLTAAAINWDHKRNWARNTWYTSPDISPLIQQIVDRPNWQTSNAAALYYSTRTVTRKQRFFAAYSIAPAQLEVTYEYFTISGTVTSNTGTPLAGVQITASPNIEPTTTNASGFYQLHVPPAWTGTTTASLAGYNFTLKSYTNVTADKTNQNFSGFQPTISGSTGQPGATVTVSGVGTTVTSNPNYSITVPYGWTGTISATLAGYNFPDSPKTYTNLTINKTGQYFTPYQPTISGSTGQPGATVTISGIGITVTSTPAYSITVPYGWSGNISATLADYNFPDSPTPYTNVTTNKTSQNFTPYQPTISGTTTQAGATVTVSDVGSVISTPAYSITVPYGWTGTVTPSLAGYGFTPKSYINVTTNKTDQNFIPYQVTISGSTTQAGATVTASGAGSVTSTPAYSITVPYEWNGNISVELAGYHFPDSPRPYTNVTTNQTNQNFTFYQPTISGTTSVSGATMTVSGVGTFVSTPAYSVTVPYGWSGTVAASLDGYHFADSPHPYTNVTTDQTGKNFTPYQPTISGSTGQAGATVIAGDIGSVVSTPAYSIAVPYGWIGNVSASLANYDFPDSPHPYTNVTTDQTGKNFTPYQPTISGSTGQAGATVIAGDIGSVVSTPAYSIAVPYGWTGNISASLADYDFPDSPHSYTNVTTDQTGKNFTPYQPTISGSTGQAGATLTVSGLDPIVSNPAYSVTVPYGWTGNISADLADYNFPDSPHPYTNVTTDQTDQNFTPYQPAISGTIYKDGEPLAGVPASADNGGGSSVTSPNGYYEIVVPYNWSGTVTPDISQWPQWGIAPAIRTYTNVTSDKTNHNYYLYQPVIHLYFLQDSQTPAGNLVAGVEVTITGFPEPIIVDGVYDLTVPYGWTGTITPSKTKVAFDPIEISFENLTEQHMEAFFRATYLYTAGDGTEADPFQIADADDLRNLSYDQLNWDKHFIVINDIDMGDPNTPNMNTIASFRSYGALPVTFTGIFDGQGFSIINLHIADYVSGGLFGIVGTFYWQGHELPIPPLAHIKNLTLINSTVIKGDTYYAGSLADFVEYGATIENCTVEGGYIAGDGGLVGGNVGTIRNCHAIDIYVEGTTYFGTAGGLVGANYGVITECSASGTVIGERDTGGLVGNSSTEQQGWQDIFALIENCSASCTVESKGTNGNYSAGGLIGTNYTSVINCSATGDVTGQNSVGGLIGSSYAYYGTPEISGIKGCFASGNVTGHGRVGGLVGMNKADIDNCFSSGIVTGHSTVGGLTGDNYYEHTISNSYSSCTVFGDQQVGGLIGHNMGFIEQSYATGDVTGEDAVGGLIGDNYGNISRCSSTSPVTGTDQVGGLLGFNQANISHCSSTGPVTGTYEVGGLIGANYSDIYECFSTGTVTGLNDVGGLIGYLNRLCGVYFSYTHSDVINSTDLHTVLAPCVGGFTGRMMGDNTLRHCYSTGTVTTSDAISIFAGGFAGFDYIGVPSEYQSCFFNIDNNPALPGIGNGGDPNVIGETTAAMKTRSTYEDRYWLFPDGPPSTAGPIWDICQGTNYPRLTWQIPAGDFLCPEGVSAEDLEFFAENWLSADGPDLNGDGWFDLQDFAIFAGNWLLGVE